MSGTPGVCLSSKWAIRGAVISVYRECAVMADAYWRWGVILCLKYQSGMG